MAPVSASIHTRPATRSGCSRTNNSTSRPPAELATKMDGDGRSTACSRCSRSRASAPAVAGPRGAVVAADAMSSGDRRLHGGVLQRGSQSARASTDHVQFAPAHLDQRAGRRKAIRLTPFHQNLIARADSGKNHHGNNGAGHGDAPPSFFILYLARIRQLGPCRAVTAPCECSPGRSACRRATPLPAPRVPPRPWLRRCVARGRSRPLWA
jgi:hypothetical protein